MKSFKILTFGITREITGQSPLIFESDAANVSELKSALMQQFPALKDLKSLAISVNQQYAEDFDKLETKDEIALIPPVAGG
ncbi:MoaD/ThiS family protein [Persicobacter diffluens]|uniref:Molybdopterin synthase sulfur carrier subunit n=1 Tax=Persicobacter diffluens TaxID=981 RepID=A0AAN4VZ14_9BACT|nr:molybdopterin converting factor small subunit [Persicobacter diffluens]